MADKSQQLHVTLFPFMAHGHMIPTLDMAWLFAGRGVKATIITTPFNLPFFTKTVQQHQMIDTEIFSFPCTENGLPDGCENVNQAITINLIPNFMNAVEMLKDQLEHYLDRVKPDCLVADMFLPWTTDSAAKFNVPRLVFHGTSYFALCAEEIIRLHTPCKNVGFDEEPFDIPFFPHKIKLTRLQIADHLWKEELAEAKEVLNRIKESELKSYGVIVNSFYELEPEYAEFFCEELGRRAWHVGPVSLCNRTVEDKAQRGEDVATNEDECLRWLDSKKQDSVLYICSGSMAHFSASQLYEIAVALEALQQEFIWVVKRDEDDLPPGFVERTQGIGIVLRGWAPQLLILEHEAVHGFLTHCGWNSILEGISAGLPMITWPIFAEQFYNEKLVTEILKIGVPVGANKWNSVPYMTDLVKQNAIEKAIRDIMEGEEAQERRNRAKKLKQMAIKAVEEDGSSYSDLDALICDLREYHA